MYCRAALAASILATYLNVGCSICIVHCWYVHFQHYDRAAYFQMYCRAALAASLLANQCLSRFGQEQGECLSYPTHCSLDHHYHYCYCQFLWIIVLLIIVVFVLRSKTGPSQFASPLLCVKIGVRLYSSSLALLLLFRAP